MNPDGTIILRTVENVVIVTITMSIKISNNITISDGLMMARKDIKTITEAGKSIAITVAETGSTRNDIEISISSDILRSPIGIVIFHTVI